jgi:hypothetical protein
MLNDRYPHVMNALAGPSAPKYTYLVFYSNIVNGRMWCPVRSCPPALSPCDHPDGVHPAPHVRAPADQQDCLAVEQTVKETFEGDDKPSASLIP